MIVCLQNIHSRPVSPIGCRITSLALPIGQQYVPPLFSPGLYLCHALCT